MPIISNPQKSIPDTAKSKKPWDLAVIGGGPVGLSAAKTAIDKGLNVVVLEQGNTCGPQVRGETITPDKIIEKIWGGKFLDDITVHIAVGMRLYSPDSNYGQKKAKPAMRRSDLDLNNTPHSIEWENFIDTMVVKVSKGGGTICLNTKVIQPLFNRKTVVTGLKTNRGSLSAHTVFDCSGHTGVIGKSFNINHDTLNMPVVKARLSGCRFNYPDFQLFFIPAGTMTSVKGSPPMIPFIFPSHDGLAEIGCMFFKGYGPRGTRNSRDPVVDNDYIMTIWNELKTRYPIFSSLVKNAHVELEYPTAIPCRGMIDNFMVRPGFAILGDAAGFVLPNRGSGLITGMQSAFWWTDKAAKKNGIQWSIDDVTVLNKQFKESIYYNEVKTQYKKNNCSKRFLWKRLRTDHRIKVMWPVIILAYRLAEPLPLLYRQLLRDGKLTDEIFSDADSIEQTAMTNSILNGKVVVNSSEKVIIRFMEIVKKNNQNWKKFIRSLDKGALYKKLQGKELKQAYTLIGPTAPLECAIAKNRKFIIVRDVKKSNLEAASLQQCNALLRILFRRSPLLNQGEEKAILIFNIILKKYGKVKLKSIVEEIGRKRIKRMVNGPQKKKLKKILATI